MVALALAGLDWRKHVETVSSSDATLDVIQSFVKRGELLTKAKQNQEGLLPFLGEVMPGRNLCLVQACCFCNCFNGWFFRVDHFLKTL
ncbi:hypothetical protein K2173_015558 [Erythroxylum novogranatense]|uniref:Uncharacterized protein n=1 Tax=Erythroxylum novogranatense TaxID=1862640 RepID=A0AAV8SEG0_9ROSI|nr:hypothetical protein K2173_015558 [Erythroxylum novogranatense]